MQVGRNDACPCGSGQKYKNCCADKSRGMSRGMMALIGAIVAIAAFGLIPSMIGDRSSKRTRDADMQAPPAAPTSAPQTAAAPATTPMPQVTTASPLSVEMTNPASPPPTSVDPATVRPASIPGSPQPGPAPAGQVWSVEHGHWHDIKTGAAPGIVPPAAPTPVTLQRQPPPGPAPAGKVWSPEHGHYH